MEGFTAINFQSLFESAPGLYLVLKPDFTIVAVSDAYLDATMTRREAIIQKGLFEVFPDNPDDPEATGVSNLRASLNSVVRNKVANTMAVQKYDIRRPDGSFEERYWSPLNKPVFNGSNEVAYIIHRVEDVTEFVRLKNTEVNQQKKTEELMGKVHEMEMEVYKRAQEIQDVNLRLLSEIEEREKAREIMQASQQMFSTFFYQSPVMNTITDAATGRFIEVNDNFAKFCGSSKEEIIGKTSLELKVVPKFKQRAELIEIIKRDGLVRDILMEATDYRGAIKWISTSADLVVINGKKCFLTAMIDVTERIAAEEILQQKGRELEEANKELESFSYSVSHDLRAPLRIIHGYTEIITSDHSERLDDEGKRMLGIVNANVRRMGQLIDDLLNLSRLGRKELAFHTINMQDLVQNIIDEIKVSGTRLPLFHIGQLNAVRSDNNLIQQVWLNLISNAIKYSRTKEQPVVEIDSKRKGSEIIYCVKDNGVGFNMKYANKLFGVFQRLHKMNEFEGTGVGLALVHRIVTRLGGRVWAEAEIDKGASFFFSLPNDKSAAPEAEEQMASVTHKA
ncbi:MAG: PAS domain S-box protein [Chitinophagaceae bacterium]